MPRVVPEYREAAKNRILQNAFLVFSRKGYHATTMEDIAREVGINKATIYLYFKNKEDLFWGMAEASREELSISMKKIFRQDNFTQDLGAFFDYVVKTNSSYEALNYELLAIAARDEDMKAMLVEDGNRQDKIIVSFLEDQQKKGYIRDDIDVGPLAIGMSALLDGLEYRISFGLNQKEAREIWVKTVHLWLA